MLLLSSGHLIYTRSPVAKYANNFAELQRRSLSGKQGNMDDGEVLSAVGPRLRGFRQALGLNLAELAERSGITASTISRLERGLVRPSLEQLLPLARVYGLPLDELVAAPRVGDPRVHLKPVRRHGLTFVPLGVHAGGLQGFKVIYRRARRQAP